MIFGIELWAAFGFAFAAYAVVGNDALQTLGTFINSNRHLHWTLLFAFASAILVATFTYGWATNGGDPSYGRLANTEKYPEIAIEWYHTLPPLVLLIITRFGIPVSTSFMVLTIFATVGGLGSMIEKSLIGYALAFAVGAGAFAYLSRTLEARFDRTEISDSVPRGLIASVGLAFFLLQYFLFGTIDSLQVLLIGIGAILALEVTGNVLAARVDRGLYWVTAQWATTGYLWSVWLIQDFANIFVFLPRGLTAAQAFSAMGVILVLLAITFANRGGPVQKILRSKSNVTDIRSATMIDFFYASLLFFFKELSDIPMSTTWVFLGLIAGREFAFALTRRAIDLGRTAYDTGSDVAKAFIGLIISVDLAVGLPFIGRWATEEGVGLGDLFQSTAFMVFVVALNLALPLVLWFLRGGRQTDIRVPVGGGFVGLTVAIGAFFGLGLLFT